MTRNGTNGRRAPHGNKARNEGKRRAAHRAAIRKRPELEPEALLPLSEPMFHILMALSERQLHGYGIIISVEEATKGDVRLRTGTLYTAIARMVEDGLIRETDSEPDGDYERRRYYRITRFGRTVARLEATRVARLTSLARARGFLSRRKS